MGQTFRLLVRAAAGATVATLGFGFAAHEVAAARSGPPPASPATPDDASLSPGPTASAAAAPGTTPTAAAPTASAPAATAGAGGMASAPSEGYGTASGVPTPRVTGPGAVSVLHLRSADGDGALRDVWVYRPAVADTAELPVLYFLHGVPGAPGDVFGAGLAEVLDWAFANGAAPFVVAAPDGRGHTHPDTEWADSADGTDRVETFVTGIVIPAVEGADRRDRAHRALAGFSMGGYGALNLAEHHPDLFGQVVSLAGYFHVDDPDHMYAGNLGLIAANSPDRHIEVVRRFRLLLLDGNRDTEPVVAGETSRFAGLLTRAGVPARVAVTPGAHDWAWVSSQLPEMVGFVEGGWAPR
ncbi:MAG: alpha/beta hydrolase [Acidimicrobiales bacterium]